MINSVLSVVVKLLWIILGIILAVLVWNTAEYFNRLPENDKNKPLLAWDTFVLLFMFIYSVIKLMLA
jgi:hypothetical protein